jgi:hypothetical protein
MITNLLSIPILEEAGYIVFTHTKGDWVVGTPKGKRITFIRDIGMYADMFETIQKKFAGASKR